MKKISIRAAGSAIYQLIMKNWFTKLLTFFIAAPIIGFSLGTLGFFLTTGLYSCNGLGEPSQANQVQAKKIPKPVAVTSAKIPEVKKPEPPAAKYDEKLVLLLQKELAGRTINFTAREGYLETMNDIADAMHLPIVTEKNLDSLKKMKFLVPTSAYLKKKGVEENLDFFIKPLNDYLENLSFEFSEKFNKRLPLNSAVRTVEKQNKLAKTNKNAAREEGSMHTRGCAADISYKNMSLKEVLWLQDKFNSLDNPKIWVIKERLGYHNFHIVVFP